MNSVYVTPLARLQAMAITARSGRATQERNSIDESRTVDEKRLRILELVKGIDWGFAAARRTSDNDP